MFSDGFSRFKAAYPEWCDSCSELLATSGTMPLAAGPDPLPLMGLRSLRISAPPLHRPHRSCDSLSSAANSSTDSSDTDDRCDSSLGKILPLVCKLFYVRIPVPLRQGRTRALFVYDLNKTKEKVGGFCVTET